MGELLFQKGNKFHNMNIADRHNPYWYADVSNAAMFNDLRQ